MRKKRINEELTHSYWQSVTDAMSGLLLLLLLILMMFMVRILYFSNSEMRGDSDYDGLGDKDYEVGYNYESRYGEHTDGRYDGRWDSHSGGGGNSGNGGNKEESNRIDDTGYAAVLVQLMDVDSKKLIQESRVQFEVYNSSKAPLQLKTYYPEEITYRYFETREDGTFYVPEKIAIGNYELRNVSNATGYELASPVSFIVDKDYNWNSPLVVTAYVGPEKNIIYIRLVNAQGVSINIRGNFEVYANEDIITEDGTVRYHKNQLVDTISCDERGYGHSEELYLGEYRIETRFDDDFYAGDDKNIVTLYSINSENGNIVNDILCEKTTITIQLSDELNKNVPLNGAEYTLVNTTTKEKVTGVTDSSGHLEFTDLYKNTTYEITQTKGIAHYYTDDETHLVYVDSLGYINGNANFDLNDTNRKIRISINVVDGYMFRPLKGELVEVYDNNGDLAFSYVSDGNEKVVEGLDYGTYKVVIESRNIQQDINVEDTAQKQIFTITTKDSISKFIFGGIIALVIVGLISLILLIKKRKSNKD